MSVGRHTVTRIEDGVNTHLFALLRDDGFISREVDEDEGPEIEFRMPGRHLADRLDVVGVDEPTVAEAFTEAVDERRTWSSTSPQDLELLDGLDLSAWIDRVRDKAATGHDQERFGPPGNLRWWMDLIDGLDYRYALRAALLAFPDEQVTVTLTDRGEGWLEGDNRSYASDSLLSMQAWGSTYSPTVVLTEGKTDAEFLGIALSVLYPHLADLVRFMDFDFKAEGSASVLVKSVRSFAAAGISNRIVALFDNDSAAEDALRVLDTARLPANFHVCQYPDLDLAMNYPTLGPPNIDSPGGVLSMANVNGLAGSVELYLGLDVLTGDDGILFPVQWKSYVPGVQRYQGEVTCKGRIHDRFRAKAAAVRANGGLPTPDQDWSGLETIMGLIISAHRAIRFPHPRS